MKCKECGQDRPIKPGDYVKWYWMPDTVFIVTNIECNSQFVRGVNLRTGSLVILSRTSLTRIHGVVHITSEER